MFFKQKVHEHYSLNKAINSLYKFFSMRAIMFLYIYFVKPQ